jgi:hypothetical protein
VRFGTDIVLDKRAARVWNRPRILVWNIAMQDYDIHLFNAAGHLSLNMSGSFASDRAAIRAAEQLCKVRERVEVWSSDGRIFASTPRVNSTLPAA